MNQRLPESRPFLIGLQVRRAHAHSLLEAELEDIRKSLRRLEEAMDSNVVSICEMDQEDVKAA
jgi:hypothetical protein